MIRGLYISATQLLTNQKLLDAIGNNVANIDSTGFKKDEIQQESFNDILITKYNGSSKNIEFGNPKVTVENNGKDYKLETDQGYFRMKTKTAISYDKTLKFSVDEKGYLSTYYMNSDKTRDGNLGDRILGLKGEIFVGDQDFTVNEQGQVLVAGQAVDSLVYKPNQDVIGTMGSGVKALRIVTDFSQGTLVPTGGNLDIGLRGQGFMEVATPFGPRYTRNGSLDLNANRELVTSEGYFIQGFNGNITLQSDNVQINEFGEIIENGEIIDKIKTVNFTNVGDLRKIGSSLFAFSENPTGEITTFEGKVTQGSVEQSNVDSISEMIKMISVQRDYESGQKLIRTIDETLSRAVNEVGTVR